MKRTDATRYQVRVREMTHAHRRIEAFADEINKAVAVRGMHLQQRMPTRELGEHGRHTRQAE
jgi:hypothetical protein